jgi:hypothetical protein
MNKQISESDTRFLDFDVMVALAELWGCEPQAAFIVAAVLRSNGMSANQARWMFQDAERRVQ